MLNILKEFFLAPAHSFLLVMMVGILSPFMITWFSAWIGAIIVLSLFVIDFLVTTYWRIGKRKEET